MSKLRKLTLKSIRESGVTGDETKLVEMLEQKVCSSDLYFLNHLLSIYEFLEGRLNFDTFEHHAIS